MLWSKWSRGQAWVALALSALFAPFVLLVSSASASDVSTPVIPASTSVAAASAILQQQISGRIHEIMVLSSEVTASHSVSASDRAALNTLLANEIAGLTNLQSTSSADRSLSQIRQDASTMVVTYHVYSFVEPVVQAVLRVDDARGAASRMARLIPSIRTTIVASSASASRITHANSLMVTLSSLVATINTITAGVGPNLLALDPSSVPASLPTIASATSTAVTASQDVRAAYLTIGRIVSLVSANPPPRHHRR